MALGKRNNGKFRPSSVEVGAPRIWIHLNRIRKKQMEEKTGTGHSLHDVISLLRVFPSIWANLEPNSNHVNRKKPRASVNCIQQKNLLSMRLGAPRNWIHLNRICKKQME